MSQNSVYAVLQDRKGFMWFGTKDGLNRYDGYTFTIFRNNSNDSTTLSDNFVTKLYEDKRGRLWVGTQNGGINLFDRQREIFYRSEFLTDLPEQFRRFNVTGITEDPFGNLWVASNGDGLFKFTVGQADDVRWQDDVSITRLYHKGGDNT
ncbi:MAG: hybrid sensor histidine kinase/response regulator, partial [Ignavibacterium sp.]